eukprot:GFYU01047636.1.p1 GENE.GFYU01047636.1~~GFYU01047636.1.p1  ORF type:complete len:133 (-),score=26.91 GFYU01047636.1:49-447(-)
MMRRMMEAHANRTEEAARKLNEDPEALKAKEEMKFWMRQMELTDEEVVGQMESDMFDMLRTMTPGSTTTRPSAETIAAAPPSSSSSAAVAASHVDPNRVDRAAPKGTFSKERVWEQYDKWEQAARRRFPAQQ